MKSTSLFVMLVTGGYVVDVPLQPAGLVLPNDVSAEGRVNLGVAWGDVTRVSFDAPALKFR